MPIKDWKKEIFTVPNLLSMCRFVLIPVYIHIYLNASEPKDYWVAAAVLALSCLTDLIDGKIARHFNMISHVGKVLDPLADKFTQIALIICLYANHKELLPLLVLFIVKESFQLFAMLVKLRQGKALDGALMAGKVSTTVLFVSLILMVLLPDLSNTAVTVLTALCCVVMLVAFVEYIRAYYGKNQKIQDLEG